MLRPEDVADLGLWLREHGLRVSVGQLGSTLRLVTGRRAPRDSEELGRWLAPLVCTDSKEQDRFADVYRAWLDVRSGKRTVDPPPPPPPPPSPTPPIALGNPASASSDSRLAWTLRWALTVFLALIALGSAAWWQGEQEVIVRVVGDGAPLEGARVEVALTGEVRTTGRNGEVRFRCRRWRLPSDIRASHVNYVQIDQLAVATGRAERGLQAQVSLSLANPPPPKPGDAIAPLGRRIAYLPASPASAAPLVTDVYRKLDPFAIGAVLLASTLLIGWYCFSRLRRRGFLERTPAAEDTDAWRFDLPADRDLADLQVDARALARDMRRRRDIHSRQLDVVGTIAASLRRAGSLHPVFGTKAEPEYVFLVERLGPRDHLTALVDDLIRVLLAHDVSIDRYEFVRTPDAAVHQPIGSVAIHTGPQTIERLRARHPEARLLLVADAATLVDRYTGLPASFLRHVQAWPRSAVLVPQSRDEWGPREQRLADSGLRLMGLDAQGLRELASIFGRDQGFGEPVAKSSTNRLLRSFLKDLDLLLDPIPLPPERLELLMDALRAELGESGMRWLAACAIYPELHWHLTLATRPANDQIGWGESQQMLSRLSRLPWLRRGFMPEWLREQLIGELPKQAEQQIRRTLATCLAAASRHDPSRSSGESLEASPDEASAWQDAWRGFRSWLAGRPVAGRVEDRVFLRYMSGARSRLAFDPGEAFLRLFYRHGARLAGPRWLPFPLVALLCTAWFWAHSPVIREVHTRQGPDIIPRPSAMVLDHLGTRLAVADDAGGLVVGQVQAEKRIVPCARTIGLERDSALAVDTRGDVFAATASPGTGQLVSVAATSTGCGEPVRGGAPTLHRVSAAVPETSGSTRWSLQEVSPAEPKAAALCASASPTKRWRVEGAAGSAPVVSGQRPLLCALSSDGSRLGFLVASGRVIHAPASAPLGRLVASVGGLPPGPSPVGMAISSKGDTVAVARADGSVWIYRDETGVWSLMGPLQAAGSMALSGEGRVLAISHLDRSVAVWRLDAVNSRKVWLTIASNWSSNEGARLEQVARQRFGFDVVRLDDPKIEDVFATLARPGFIQRNDSLVIFVDVDVRGVGGSGRADSWLVTSGNGLQNLKFADLNSAIRQAAARDILLIADAAEGLLDGVGAPGQTAEAANSRHLLSQRRSSAEGLAAPSELFVRAVARALATTQSSLSGAQLASVVARDQELLGRGELISDKSTKKGSPKLSAPPTGRVIYQAMSLAGHATGDIALSPLVGVQPFPVQSSASQRPLSAIGASRAASSSVGGAAVTGRPESAVGGRVPSAVPVGRKESYRASSLFSNQSATLTAEGMQVLDGFIERHDQINLEVVVIVWRIDSSMASAEAQRLGVQRSEAIKGFLVSRGLRSDRIYSESVIESRGPKVQAQQGDTVPPETFELELAGTRTPMPSEAADLPSKR